MYPASNAHAPYYVVICVLLGRTFFFTLSQKRHHVREKVVEDKVCVLVFSAAFVETFLIPRRIQRYVVIMIAN